MEELSPYHSLPEAFSSAAATRPTDTAYLFIAPDGSRHARTYAEVLVRVQHLARHLSSCGVSNGTRVAILSNTRPEWSEADLAITWLGGITVSIYPSLPTHDVGVILADSGAEIVFAENEEQVGKLNALRGAPLVIAGEEEETRITISHLISFEVVENDPSVVPVTALFSQSENTPVPLATIHRDDIAALVYTSGTTGVPKGVMQTHRNHLTNVVQASESGVFGLDGILFLYLPSPLVCSTRPVAWIIDRGASSLHSGDQPEALSRRSRRRKHRYASGWCALCTVGAPII